MTDELLARVEKLERENRRFRWGAVVILLIGCGALLLGQASRENTTDKVRTRILEIVDESGRSCGVITGVSGGAVVMLTGDGDSSMVGLVFGGPGPTLRLTGKGGEVSLRVGERGPSVRLQDGNGYESVLGVTNLVAPKTGEVTTRSAASLVMFDNKKNVIWRAP